MSKVSYQRLRQEVIFEDEIKERRSSMEIIKRSLPRISWFGKLRRRKLRIKFRGFRRFFKIRRSIKVAKRSRVSCAKVLKRLKESQSHFGDLFAGNYLFLQVTPGSLNKHKITNSVTHHKYYQNNAFSSFSHSLNYMC